jgi:hypothetical protein
MWDPAELEVWSSVSHEHVLWCHCRFLNSGEEFFLANVYAPCDSREKQVLWDSLTDWLQSLTRKRVCVVGGF